MAEEYAVYVPSFAGSAPMNAISSIVKYASNVLKNAAHVPIAAREWLLKVKWIKEMARKIFLRHFLIYRESISK